MFFHFYFPEYSVNIISKKKRIFCRYLVNMCVKDSNSIVKSPIYFVAFVTVTFSALSIKLKIYRVHDFWYL